ncbi:NAC domain-containing protein 69-like [Trifolium pratense]|nr:NAC domain-containing protein 69-like [Trifolium pratense]
MTTSLPILNFLPVGFRFRPTDEELVNHYLKNKLLGNDYIVNNVLAEVDVCKFEPCELPAVSVIKSVDPEWFFLSPCDYKYAKSKRFNRATKFGFWKATGIDRKIKIRGTNKIIGIKKTLVYYHGRIPGVKSNWVIHEYHDVTLEENKRNFVLCRLMRKAETKAEEEADIMIYDEGEPSRNLSSSDHENQETVEGIPDVISGTLQEINMQSIFQAPYQAENYYPFSTQQSSISENEPEVLIPNLQLHNAYFRNVNKVDPSPFKTPEEEDTFVNSMLTDGEYIASEKRKHTFINSPVRSESLRMAYYESSDTDAEVVSTPYGSIMDTSMASLQYLSPGEYYASKMLKSTHFNVYGSTYFPSFNNGENDNKMENTFQDDFGGVAASSCDSTANKS